MTNQPQATPNGQPVNPPANANGSTPPPGVDPQEWQKDQHDLAVYNQQMAQYQAQQAAAQGAPQPQGAVPPKSVQQGPLVGRPSGRRRPRFVEKPKKQDDTLVARRNLLTATKTAAGQHQFSRERKIAGNLPDWDPMPPGEIRVARHAG